MKQASAELALFDDGKAASDGYTAMTAFTVLRIEGIILAGFLCVSLEALEKFFRVDISIIALKRVIFNKEIALKCAILGGAW